MKAHPLRVLGTIALAFAGCATGQGRAVHESSRDPGLSQGTTARETLFAADFAHTDAMAKSDPVEGLLAPMRDDAIYLADGIPIVRGKSEIASALRAESSAGPPAAVSRTLAGGDASADGRFGFTFG
jgi:hypothetical protein